MTEPSPVVFVVDDDDAVRSGLRMLLASAGLDSRCYGNALEFLEAATPEQGGCLLLDVRMPGLSGLDLHERLIAKGITLPVIILTGHGDVPMAVRAMKRGAFDFIQKPFNDQFLLDRINAALQRDSECRGQQREAAALRDRLARLTTREHEVMRHLVRGEANKVIAAELGISERTIELHRARCMEKLNCRSVAQLVHLVLRAESGTDAGQ
ncbi:MAG: response regulator [Pseudomonadota bacterium]|nr:response regulator [Pseudomonadota bacterium]